jgi:diacylglycerol kinase family enzyme
MKGKTLLIVNPIAGKGAAKRHLVSIISRLTDGGCEVTVLPTKKGN